jgi:multiple sugar transport system substrate-binding protein
VTARGLRSIFLLAFLLLAACSQSGTESTSEPSAVTNDELPPVPSFWQGAAKPYRGQVLRGITENTPPSLYIRDVLAPAFEQETGIKIKLEITTNPPIEQSIKAGADHYDFVYVEQDVIYEYLAQHRLSNITKLLRDNAALVAPLFNPDDFTDFINAFRDPATGDLYGMPIEGFIKVYLYRKDLFDDPAIQNAFAAEYHYPLARPLPFKSIVILLPSLPAMAKRMG